MSIRMTLENMGHAFRTAQRRGYYSDAHSLASATTWALSQCSNLLPSSIVRYWMDGYKIA